MRGNRYSILSRFLQVDIDTGVLIGMVVVFIYSVLGGMKGITYTQVTQYVVMIFFLYYSCRILSYKQLVILYPS